jgi:hypothetical protein
MTKKSFCDNNLESLKIGVTIGFSLCGICVIIIGIILNMYNPNLGFLIIPLTLQSFLVSIIKKEPRSLLSLKTTMQNILNKEDDTDVNTFIDDMVSTHTKNTARIINEPIVNQITERTERTENNNKRVHMNAYYDEVNDTYYITPRVVYK